MTVLYMVEMLKQLEKSFESMRSEEDWRASQLLVERDMFPENRRVKRNMRISLEIEIEKMML